MGTDKEQNYYILQFYQGSAAAVTFTIFLTICTFRQPSHCENQPQKQNKIDSQKTTALLGEYVKNCEQITSYKISIHFFIEDMDR